MNGDVLDIIVYYERGFDEDIYKGVLKGLDTYFIENNKEYEFKPQEIEKSPYAIYQDHKIDADATVYKMLKSIFGEKNRWVILLTTHPMFYMEENVGTCDLVGFFNDISNIGRYDLGSCAISDYMIKDGDAEISFARGLIVSYHEAHHHNNLEVHCNELNCVRGQLPFYQLCSFAEQWVETKVIPTCEAHKVADSGDE